MSLAQHLGSVPKRPTGRDCKSFARASKVQILLGPPRCPPLGAGFLLYSGTSCAGEPNIKSTAVCPLSFSPTKFSAHPSEHPNGRAFDFWRTPVEPNAFWRTPVEPSRATRAAFSPNKVSPPTLPSTQTAVPLTFGEHRCTAVKRKRRCGRFAYLQRHSFLESANRLRLCFREHAVEPSSGEDFLHHGDVDPPVELAGHLPFHAHQLVTPRRMQANRGLMTSHNTGHAAMETRFAG
jgi:hypothetical protein